MKKRTNQLSILSTALIAIATLIAVSCNDVLEIEPSQSQLFGEKLENPYSIDNMQKAWDNIRPQLKANGRINGDEVEVVTTHYYVKFLPKDSLEMEILNNIPDLELYSYPLDYENSIEGEVDYHDPSISPNKPTFQYTAVFADFDFPSVEYEILEELFLPDDIGHTSSGRVVVAVDNCIEMALVNEAMRITNNLKEILPIDDCGRGGGSGGGGGGSSTCTRCPRGQILVHNPISGTIIRNGGKYDGVPKVKARARKWFKIKTAETNDKGEFVIKHVFGGDRKVNLGIKYTNKHAFIKPSAIGFGPAFLNGPKTKNRWEYRSHKGLKSYLWGTIMRAVYDYHYKYAPQLGIGAPPNDVKIRACAGNDCGVTTMLHHATSITLFGRWLFSDIRIGHKNQVYEEIYATTIHELGHAAHWKLSGDWVVSRVWKIAWAHKMVREAWASGLTDHIYPIKFPDLGRYYYGTCANNSRLRLAKMKSDGYPRILIRDLIDNVNEFNASNNNCNYLNDNVSGFTMREVFYSLEDAYGSSTSNALEKWRDHLGDRRSSQKQNLKTYFEPWEE